MYHGGRGGFKERKQLYILQGDHLPDTVLRE
jgi:hypothetical protein